MPKVPDTVWATVDLITIVDKGRAGLLGVVITNGPKAFIGKTVLVRLSAEDIARIRKGDTD